MYLGKRDGRVDASQSELMIGRKTSLENVVTQAAAVALGLRYNNVHVNVCYRR
jgi:hypothetical protein